MNRKVLVKAAATWMDLWQLKRSELAEHLQTYEGRVVLRRDNVKDGLGCTAVFTAQGTAASQVTAPKVLDTRSHLTGMAGAANEAISACTQVKMKHAPGLFKLLVTDGLHFGISHRGNRHPANWDTIPPSRNFKRPTVGFQ